MRMLLAASSLFRGTTSEHDTRSRRKDTVNGHRRRECRVPVSWQTVPRHHIPLGHGASSPGYPLQQVAVFALWTGHDISTWSKLPKGIYLSDCERPSLVPPSKLDSVPR
ncbi:hypothetical protein V499_00720 [Pseudogymnoascus sp. VKM F-103]|nr:hypothetical protein V499_00720 [Pseudogymnoascus sp. VKM F-103]